MEIMTELSDAELDAVVGGAGSATLTITNTASGTTVTVSGTFCQSMTASVDILTTEGVDQPHLVPSSASV